MLIESKRELGYINRKIKEPAKYIPLMTITNVGNLMVLSWHGS